MKKLLPHFIQENFLQNCCEGEFEAITIFIDISGFTAMTNALMQYGSEGAEILSSILNRIFDPTVNIIYKYGGFIATFAGDAFTAIFPHTPENNPIYVVDCARKIQAIFNRNGRQETIYTTFEIQVKIGLAVGSINWAIVGKNEKAYYFRGPGIDDCVRAEQHARKGEIVMTSGLRDELTPDVITLTPLADDCHRVEILKAQTTISIPSRSRRPRISRSVIGSFLPDSIVGFKHTGEFRNCAIAFLAFDGTTDKVVMDQFVSLLIDHCQFYEGYLNKIDFGDKGSFAMLVFGAPVAHENNIERCLDCLLAIRADVPQSARLSHLALRAGITYGVVFAGIIGSQKRCEYTVIGDSVNLASRLMTHSQTNQFLVSESIAQGVEEYYTLENIGPITVKGLDHPLLVHALLGKKGLKEKTFIGKFIGRSTEITRARALFAKLERGRFGGLIYIYGEAGVGKSRFIHELRLLYPDYFWLDFACDGVLKKAFNPFSSAFQNYFQQNPEKSREANRASFEAIYAKVQQSLHQVDHPHLEANAIDEIDRELTRLQPVMAGFLGIAYDDSLFQQLDGKGRYENTIYAFKELIKSLSLARPTIIVVEDLHWIDDDSRKAFQTIGRHVDHCPFMIIVSSRYADDGSKPSLTIDADTREIDLGHLSRDGIAEFAESILNAPLAENLLDHIVGKTNGNPFFVEQTIVYYRESEIIKIQDRQWQMVKSAAAIPASVNDLLIARIDRLAGAVKEVVQTAAVLGQEFEIRLLSAMLGSGQTVQHLRVGEQAAIWTSLTELKYIFSHALLQDAVYKMQLKTRLRGLHELAAQTLEQLFPNDPGHYSDLAFHYERAENVDKAIEYLEKAGDHARENYQNAQAIDFYDRLIPILKREIKLAAEAAGVEPPPELDEI